MNKVDFEELVGKKIIDIKLELDSILFITDKGNYQLCHIEEWSEDVVIDDICGELKDLVGETIITAKETFNYDNPKFDSFTGLPNDSHTWSFYHISTLKTHITIKFYGTSNGYYSETADLYEYEL